MQGIEIIRFGWIVGAVVVVGACGPESGGDGSSETAGTDPFAERCMESSITTGIFGRTEQRTCDIGEPEECVQPAVGLMVSLYDRNAQVGSDALGWGTLDPEAVELDGTASGAGGEFEFELSAGTYHACGFEGDQVNCSGAIEVGGATAVFIADFEYGNGSSWSIRACEP